MKDGTPSNSVHNSVFTSTTRMNVKMNGSKSSRLLGGTGNLNDVALSTRKNPAEISVASISSIKKTSGLLDNIKMLTKKAEKRTPCLKIDLNSSSQNITLAGSMPSGVASRSTQMKIERHQ